MRLPKFISDDEWDLIVEKSLQYRVNPALPIAIGWHETNWERLGWGRLGYHLGVGCFNEKEADERFKGLENQLDWACGRISEFLPFRPTLDELKRFCGKVWRPANCNSWSKSVYGIYKNLMKNYFPEFLIYDAPPSYAVQPLFEFYKKGYLNFPWGTNTFYRLIVILSNVLKKDERR